MPRFTITYAIVTPESAEQGENDETGIITHDETSLREAIKELFSTRTNRVDGIECIECDYHAGRFTAYVNNGMEFETGAHESRCMHAYLTPASAARVSRLIKN